MPIISDITQTSTLTIQIGAVVIWLGLVFLASEILHHLKQDPELVRKVVHIGTGNVDSVVMNKGDVVYAFGTTGNKMSVKLASNGSDATSAKTVGVVYSSSIAINGLGFIITQGVCDGLNLGSFTAGDTVYLSSFPGVFTATKPYAPEHLVYVGIVERANNGDGLLFVRVQNG